MAEAFDGASTRTKHARDVRNGGLDLRDEHQHSVSADAIEQLIRKADLLDVTSRPRRTPAKIARASERVMMAKALRAMRICVCRKPVDANTLSEGTDVEIIGSRQQRNEISGARLGRNNTARLVRLSGIEQIVLADQRISDVD